MLSIANNLKRGKIADLGYSVKLSVIFCACSHHRVNAFKWYWSFCKYFAGFLRVCSVPFAKYLHYLAIFVKLSPSTYPIGVNRRACLHQFTYRSGFFKCYGAGNGWIARNFAKLARASFTSVFQPLITWPFTFQVFHVYTCFFTSSFALERKQYRCFRLF